jgi:hypothetical protein
MIRPRVILSLTLVFALAALVSVWISEESAVCSTFLLIGCLVYIGNHAGEMNEL